MIWDWSPERPNRRAKLQARQHKPALAAGRMSLETSPLMIRP
jgi:hypothetical protein